MDGDTQPVEEPTSPESQLRLNPMKKVALKRFSNKALSYATLPFTTAQRTQKEELNNTPQGIKEKRPDQAILPIYYFPEEKLSQSSIPQNTKAFSSKFHKIIVLGSIKSEREGKKTNT